MTDIQVGEDLWQDEETLQEMYTVRRMSTTEIGDELGCSSSTVSNWLMKFDIDRREPRRDYGHDRFPWRDEGRLREMYVGERLTTTEIAEELGCDHSTVAKWLNRHGIETRHVAKRPPNFFTNAQGYEFWQHQIDGENHHVKVHRLLAVAEFGYDAVCGMDVHHENGVRWDNRPANIRLMGHGEHASYHNLINDGVNHV